MRPWDLLLLLRAVGCLRLLLLVRRGPLLLAGLQLGALARLTTRLLLLLLPLLVHGAKRAAARCDRALTPCASSCSFRLAPL